MLEAEGEKAKTIHLVESADGATYKELAIFSITRCVDDLASRDCADRRDILHGLQSNLRRRCSDQTHSRHSHDHMPLERDAG
jgi:hypothetical protein